jgi:DNA-binding Lrp family transcriptional regulator
MNWMTETDRKSLVEWTTYPGKSGKEISEITGISQSSLLRSKRRLLEAGILRPVKIPNFKRVGLHFMFVSFGTLKKAKQEDIPVSPYVF